MGIGRREFSFLVLSGIATGASWLLYYGAIQLGRRAAADLALVVAVILAMTSFVG